MLEVDRVLVPESSLLEPDCISFHESINEGESVSLGRTQSDGDDNVSGSGVLCLIVLSSRSGGVDTVRVRNVMIIDQAGNTNPDLGNLVKESAIVVVW
jgi:hypothetical protein